MQYILRWRKASSVPETEREDVERLPGVTLTDESARMLVVEGDEDVIRSFAADRPQWLLAPVTQIAFDDPRQRFSIAGDSQNASAAEDRQTPPPGEEE